MINAASGALAQPVQFLKGVGPKKGAALQASGISTVGDLLLHVPRRYLDRSSIATVAGLRSHLPPEPGRGGSDVDIRSEATVIGEVRSFRLLGMGARARFVLVLADQTGSLQCIWFGGVHFWKRRFAVGDVLAVSGTPTWYGSVLQFVHPDVDWMTRRGDEADAGGEWKASLRAGTLIPMYPGTQDLTAVGLDSRGMRRLIAPLLSPPAPPLPDPMPEGIRERRMLPALAEALAAVHRPAHAADIAPALRRLKFGELFEFQLKLALRRRQMRQAAGGIAFAVQSRLARQFVDALPFALTSAQVRVIKEILADMSGTAPMNRLLQGDVGSGKTVVALVAMLVAVENGYQAALMAPTEILAEQHFRTITSLLGPLAVSHRLLVGAQRSRLRRDVLEDMRTGTAQIVVGTHALFEEDVAFARLGFVVIDEQHRFGVMQRARLRAKGITPDVLVMTATPIPRTLSMTLYGDLDVSVLDALPAGRRPVTTTVRSEEEKEHVYAFVRERIAEGRQAYFVYPLVEESAKLELKAATVHWEHLQRTVFPGLRVGLLHGRMTGEEKERIMQSFKARELDVLVATTVIEVGIDVPNATVMVIENAERFGLSQLHQLRGRVGRGSEQSYCVLLTEGWIRRGARRLGDAFAAGVDTEQRRNAERRLAAMAQTNDGFAIAEMDLALRGPGDYFGTRQSGLPEFRVADLVADGELLAAAREDALALVNDDPHLRRDEHRALADHLRSRFRDELPLLHAG